MSFVRNLFPSKTYVPLSPLATPQRQDSEGDANNAQPGPSSRRFSSRRPLYEHLSSVHQSSVSPHILELSSLTPTPSGDESYSLHPIEEEGSVCSTPTNTPLRSRASSPHALYFSGTSSCSSDDESDQGADTSLLANSRRHAPWQSGERSHWRVFSSALRTEGQPNRRRGRGRWSAVWGYKSCKRLARRAVRHPFIPKTPITIVLTLALFTIFGVSLTFLIIYILNPDKEPLPWRGYCTLPQYSAGPPPLSMSTTAFLRSPISTNVTIPPFPPPDFDSLAPAGVFLGVFSMDASVERRMLVRSTWAAHARSREGAGEGDGGLGTSRTLVRFILGRPRKDYERRVQLEMEMYKDMVILPITENMNAGKTHAYFSWASENAWVPPVYLDTYDKFPTNFTYLNASQPAPLLAIHDPIQAHQDQLMNPTPKPWVRPDFVLKADDDAFVMLAELEARLRVELYTKNLPPSYPSDLTSQSARESPLGRRQDDSGLNAGNSSAAESSAVDTSAEEANQTTISERSSQPPYISRPPPTLVVSPPPAFPLQDPLVFWGYLIKNRFMGGELYALSYSLVNWVANEPLLKTMTRGAEDKQTSKWIRLHPFAQQVRWSSQRCWIYDHPRGGTVYSHGFLFPSEVKRVQARVHRDLDRLAQQEQASRNELFTLTHAAGYGQYATPPERWAHSTVSKWGSRYAPAFADPRLDYSVEALVEGSEMSVAFDDGSTSAELAWKYREGRRRRYDKQRVGGTVAVHFIKKNMWFLETASALLHGDEVTQLERSLEV